MIAETRNKIGKELVVTLAPFRVILDREGEGIIAEPDLLDDVIGRAPGFDLEPVSEFIQGLMMGAVDPVEAMNRRTIGAERLDIVILHFRGVMPGNVEVQGPPKRDIEKLQLRFLFCSDLSRQAPVLCHLVLLPNPDLYHHLLQEQSRQEPLYH